MANERRIRDDYAFGTLSVGLSATATSMQSNALANLPAVDAYSYAAITLHNPSTGAYEIVWVTAHTAAATTATIVRGREGTTAQIWGQNAIWLHGPTSRDVVLAGNPRTLFFDDCDSSTLPDGVVIDGATGTATFNSQYRRRELVGVTNYWSAPFVMPSGPCWVDVEFMRLNVNTLGSVNVNIYRGGVQAAGTRVGLFTSQQNDNNDVIYLGTGTTSGTASTAMPKVGRFKVRFQMDVNAWEAAIEYGLGANGPVRGRFGANPTVAAGDVLQVGVTVAGTAQLGLFRVAVTA